MKGEIRLIPPIVKSSVIEELQVQDRKAGSETKQKGTDEKRIPKPDANAKPRNCFKMHNENGNKRQIRLVTGNWKQPASWANAIKVNEISMPNFRNEVLWRAKSRQSHQDGGSSDSWTQFDDIARDKCWINNLAAGLESRNPLLNLHSSNCH